MVHQSQFIEMFGTVNNTRFDTCRIGDLATIKHGYPFDGHYFSEEDNGVMLVTPGNFMIGGGFQEIKCKFFTGSYPEEYVLKAGDLIVTMTDLSKQSDTLGFGALVPFRRDRIYLHNQRIGLFEDVSPLVDRRYLRWCLQTAEYRAYIISSATGSIIKHTSPSRIQDAKVILPPITDQLRFISICNHADKSKFGGCKSQFIEMFGGSFSSNATAPLSEMVQEDRPITYGVIKPGDFVEEGVVLVRVKDIVDGKILLADLRRITNSVAQNYLRSTLSPGDILLSIRGTVGRTAIVPEELDGANITQDTARISLKEEYNNHFIRCVLDSPVIQDWIQLHVKGLAVKGINLEDVRRIPIPSVEDELQEEYTTLYHQADKSKYLN